MSGVRPARSSHYATTRTALKTPTYGTGRVSTASNSSNSSLSSSGTSGSSKGAPTKRPAASPQSTTASSGASPPLHRRKSSPTASVQSGLSNHSVQSLDADPEEDEGRRYKYPARGGSTSSMDSLGSGGHSRAGASGRYHGTPTKYTRVGRTSNQSEGSKTRQRSSSRASLNSASSRYREHSSGDQAPRKRGSVISNPSTSARGARSSPNKEHPDTQGIEQQERSSLRTRRIEADDRATPTPSASSSAVRSPNRVSGAPERASERPSASSYYTGRTAGQRQTGHPSPAISTDRTPSTDREYEQMRATIEALQQEVIQLRNGSSQGVRSESPMLHSNGSASSTSSGGGGGKMVVQREGNRLIRFPTLSMDISKRQNLGSGMVYRCNMGGYTFVAKKIEINSDSGKQELAILERLNHKNIVTFLGHEKTDRGDSCFMFMEYMPYTLHSYMNRLQLQRRAFRESQMRTVATEIVKGLHYLHHQAGTAVMHRDLKSKNVLLDADQDGEIQSVKLCDFGVSKVLTPGAEPNTMVGTYYWMAPEILADTAQPYTQAADIWSYGMVLVEVATLKTPYSENGMNWSLTKQQILSGTLPKIPSSCPSFLMNLIQACLRRRPEDRPTTEQVILMLLEE